MEQLSVALGVLTASFLTLAVFSFLYRDNPVYRFAEHLFVGIAAGYFIVTQYYTVFLPNLLIPLWKSVKGLFTGNTFSWWDIALIAPFIIGLMMFAQLSKKQAWMARWPMAVVIGSFSGVAVIGFAQGDLIPQIYANMIPFIKHGSWTSFIEHPGFFTFLDLIWNPVLIIGVITVLSYFFFSRPHVGLLGVSASLGMGFLMISFGASYGNTVMTRISLLIERVMFLSEHAYQSILLLILFIFYFVFADVILRKNPIRSDEYPEG